MANNRYNNGISLTVDEQAKLFQTIVNHSRDLICLIDKQGVITYASPVAGKLTGYSSKELTGQSLLTFVRGEEDKKQWIEVLKHLAQPRPASTLRYPFVQKSGEERWFEARTQQILDDDGEVTQILVNIRDITLRIEEERMLRRLSLIARQTTNTVMITDAEERITFVNAAFEKMTGYTEAEVLGQRPGPLLQGPETNPETKQIMHDAVQQEKPFSVDIINYTKSGEKFWSHINCEPMYDGKNNLIGFFSIQSDITHQKEYENHIASLNKTLNEQNNRLQQVNRSLDEFAYVASHDLKAPLRNIMGMVDLIEKYQNQPEKLEKYMDVLKRSTREMSRLIETLLEYSRTGRISEEAENLALPATVKEVLGYYNKPLQEIAAEVHTDIQVEEIEVYPTLFKRMLSNLISNAIKYRRDQTLQLRISVAEKENAVQIAIADNGIGIEKKNFERIFRIFNSLHPHADSNGIGLSVCKKIAELHGGKITVDSTPGKGSTFTIVMPKKQG